MSTETQTNTTGLDPGYLGATDATAAVAADMEQGLTADMLEQRHGDHSAWLANQATTPAGQAYAAEYALTQQDMIASLRDETSSNDVRDPAAQLADRPESYPYPGVAGSPHPDPEVAARGWIQADDRPGYYIREAAPAQTTDMPLRGWASGAEENTYGMTAEAKV